jgi:ribosomal protein S18 acetylase RimI-like enzyme
MRGTWPEQLTLRRGWAKAMARPWNDDFLGVQLRLVRGNRDFVADCAVELAPEYGEVVSPPLPTESQKLWKEAGFKPWLHLDLFSRDLHGRIDPPGIKVENGEPSDWEMAIAIDRLAFEPTWRLGAAGLAESREATPRSSFLVSHRKSVIIGFAIVGVAGSVSYLQRVAVHPDDQGKGFGRSLVRASLRWGQRHGASSMLLNTQPENQAAGRLYMSEGFVRLSNGLDVLKFESS